MHKDKIVVCFICLYVYVRHPTYTQVPNCAKDWTKNCAKIRQKMCKKLGKWGKIGEKENCAVIQGGPPLSVKYKT